MIFLSFLACETMVGYSPARLLPLVVESPERCNLFGLLGNFQRYGVLRLGKFPNKLWYFPLVNIRVPTSVLSFTTSSALVFSVAASSALRIGLAPLVSSALPIGTRAYRTGSRSSHYTHYSVWTCRKCVPRTLLSAAHRLSALPCRCQGNSRFVNRLPICPPPLRDWKRSSR